MRHVRQVAQQRRDVSGVFLLDKPTGLTSNAALQQVKNLFSAAKAGHTGSLDPLATGLLPICLGEATKFSNYLLEADKQYRVQARLGLRTDSGDSDGEVLSRRAVAKDSTDRIPALLAEHFTGEIVQTPPMYSAVKKGGVPLYVYARKGEVVERKARRVQVHEITLRSVDGELVELGIRCSKGTYVRTIVDDLGEMLGCGATVTSLRRVAVGPYDENSMLSMDVLRDTRTRAGMGALDALLMPVETPVSHWPGVDLSEICVGLIRRGQAVRVADLPDATWVRLIDAGPDGRRFVGVGEVLEDGRVAPRRLVRH